MATDLPSVLAAQVQPAQLEKKRLFLAPSITVALPPKTPKAPHKATDRRQSLLHDQHPLREEKAGKRMPQLNYAPPPLSELAARM